MRHINWNKSTKEFKENQLAIELEQLLLNYPEEN
jgi:hypothetical protein